VVETDSISYRVNEVRPKNILQILSTAAQSARSLSIESGYVTDETMEQILQKIVAQAKAAEKDGAGDTNGVDGPPISIRSLLELAWGLSINFSHDSNQREVGNSIRKKVLEIFGSYQNILDKEGKIKVGTDIKAKKFLDNIIFSMAETVKNIGFTRNNHQNSLNALSKEYQNTEKFYNDLASFTSLKESGIAPKVFSFVGGGGILPSIAKFKEIFPSLSKNESDQTAANGVDSAITNGSDPETTNQTVQGILEFASEFVSQFPGEAVGVFIVFGIMSLAIVNMIFIVGKKRKLTNAKDKILCQQKKYYIRNYRRNMALVLMNFHKDIQALIERIYGSKYKESLDELRGIIIEQDEFKWIYENSRYEIVWIGEAKNEGTYTIDENKCNCDCMEQKQLKRKFLRVQRKFLKKLRKEAEDSPKTYHGTYRLDSKKMLNGNRKLTSDEKLWFFIAYKILPTWFTPMHPEQTA